MRTTLLIAMIIVTFLALAPRSASAGDLARAVTSRTPASGGMEFGSEIPWSGQTEFSFLSTQGNSETLSLGVKASGKRNWVHWAIQAKGEYLQSRDAVNIIAESYLLGSRGTRKFLGFDAFTDLEYQSNKFAGFTNLYKIAFGLGKEFLKTEHQAFRFEAGPAVVVEESTEGRINRFSSLSAQLLHEWTLATQVRLNSRLSYLGNLRDLLDSRYEIEVGMAAPVSQLFSLKAAYLAQYRNLPPVNAKNFDGKTTLSILATF